jgi:general secretion pathway protein B
MSYILEALRRADAERERGAVPGLHAQSTVGELEIPPTRERRPGVAVAAGVGVLAVAVGAIAWFGPWRETPAPGARTAAAPATAETPAATPVHPTAADAVAPPAAVPAQPPQAATAMSPLPMASSLPPEVSQPRAPAPATPTAATPATRGAPAAAARDAAAPKAPAAAPASGAMMEGPVEHYGPPLAAAAPPAPAPAPAPAANAVRKLAELPPGVRSQLPNLTVGGAIYSDTPSGRMLILNGQVYHEGDKPAADTVLEQIRLKSAVLNYRGTRYEIAY